jgi:hypothetical protein
LAADPAFDFEFAGAALFTLFMKGAVFLLFVEGRMRAPLSTRGGFYHTVAIDLAG